MTRQLVGAAPSVLTSAATKAYVDTLTAKLQPIDLGNSATAALYGIVGDAIYITDASMTSGSATVTSVSALFTSAMNGKIICVRGAAASGAALIGTFTYTSSTQGTVSSTASTTISNAQCCVGTNDQTGLQNALNALSYGQSLLLGRGKRYMHSGVLTQSVSGSWFDGNLSGVLLGYTQAACTIKINAAGCSVVDLTHFLPGTTSREGTPESSSLWVNQVSGFYGNRTTVSNSGMFFYGASDFELVDALVIDSMGDGIHMTYGCYSGKVLRPTVNRPGDDGVAVVSYLADPAICKDIEVRNPKIQGQTYGRGISVVGAKDITYTDIDIFGSDGAAVYISEEANVNWTSYPVTRIKVLGGKIESANRNVNSSGDHGSVLIFGEASSHVLSGINISDLVISDTRPGATENFRVSLPSGSTLSNCTVDRIKFKGAGPNYDWPSGGWTSGITATNIDNLYKEYADKVATSDTTISSTSSVQIANGWTFGWGISSIGTYEMILEGLFQSSVTTQGPRFGVAGNVSAVGTVQTIVEQNTSATAVTKTVLGWASNGGVNPGTASTSFPIRVRALVPVTTIPGNATLQFTWQMSGTGTGTIKAGTVAKLRRLS